ncbi:MAG TPA: amidohydrolase [Methanosarcinales archaeon]|nr:amidohydrolase [Methanosarcinales archaeon]
MIGIKGGKIYTITNGIIKNGVILVQGNKIIDIGKDIKVPKDAEVIDASDKIIMPGLIDAHCHTGLDEEGIGFEGRDSNEIVDPVTPHFRVIDGINPEDPGIKESLESGITTVCVLPGSVNVIGGQGAVLKTYGKIVDEMIIKEPAALKVGFGENPKKGYKDLKKSPRTRMAIAAILRENLTNAINYMRKLEIGKNYPEKMPDIDLKMKALMKVLNRKIPLRAHAHRADDIMTAIRISKEFNVDIVIEHATEGYKIAKELAKNNIDVVVGPLYSSRTKYELRDLNIKSPSILTNIGVNVSLMTDHPVIPEKYLLREAMLAVKGGLNKENALKTVTINPAKTLKLQDRIGSLEIGKDADIIIMSGDPFSMDTEVHKVLVNGKIAVDK